MGEYEGEYRGVNMGGGVNRGEYGVKTGGEYRYVSKGRLQMDAPPGSMHYTPTTGSMYPPEVQPPLPGSMHPQKYSPEDRRSTGGQYASYCNAF